jgi:hypothetical protein
MLESIEVSLKRDLLCGMGKPSVAKLALEPQILPKQERLDANTVSPHVLTSSVPWPNKIPECLVQRVWYPDIR